MVLAYALANTVSRRDRRSAMTAIHACSAAPRSPTRRSPLLLLAAPHSRRPRTACGGPAVAGLVAPDLALVFGGGSRAGPRPAPPARGRALQRGAPLLGSARADRGRVAGRARPGLVRGRWPGPRTSRSTAPSATACATPRASSDDRTPARDPRRRSRAARSRGRRGAHPSPGSPPSSASSPVAVQALRGQARARVAPDRRRPARARRGARGVQPGTWPRSPPPTGRSRSPSRSCTG